MLQNIYISSKFFLNQKYQVAPLFSTLIICLSLVS